jgi:hypothetical protein
MKINIYAQVEISDQVLLEQLGENLSALTASHAIEHRVCNTVTQRLLEIPGALKAAAVPLLDMIGAL